MSKEYNFDMQQLLDIFDGDAEKLADAFAESLNNELAERRKVNHIDEAAKEVADAWEVFIDEYFDANELPSGYVEEDFYIDIETVKVLVQFCIKLMPYLTMLEQYAKKINELSNNVLKQSTVTPTTTTATTAIKKDDLPTTNFNDIMEEFFKKNNI